MLNGFNGPVSLFSFYVTQVGGVGAWGQVAPTGAEGTNAPQDAMTWSTPDPQAQSGLLNTFKQSFTPEIVASLFGLDPARLTPEQTENLTKFLFDIDQENLKRTQAGQPALTREEINQSLAQQMARFQATGGVEEGLGKTLSELGLTELSEQQFNQVQTALQQFDSGQPVTPPSTEQPADQTQTADQGQATDQGQAADQAYAAGDTGGSQGPATTGGTSTSGGATGPQGTGQNPVPKVAEDLPALQQQKAEAQNKVGTLKGQIDSKNAAINQRKSDLAKKAAENGQTEAAAKLQGEFDAAMKTSNDARALKETAQTELSKTNLDLSKNSQDLYRNAADRQANASALGSAQGELGALKAPSAPSGEDPEAQEGYQSALSEYQSKKGELEGKVRQLESERDRLQADWDRMEADKARLEADKARFEQEIATNTDSMARAQATMDEKMKALQEADPALKQAIEEDSEIQGLQAEIQALEVDIAAHQAHIAEVDAAIAAKEAEDPVIRELREDEAEKAFQATLEQADAPTENLQVQARNELAQEKYDKPYSELTEEEKKDLEFDVEGRSTVEAMEWAEDRLRTDPGNPEARALVEAGQAFLDQRAEGAQAQAVAAMEALPDELKTGASAAMAEAITQAQAEGGDLDAAAKEALAVYTQSQLERDDLAEEDRAALESAAAASYQNYSASADAESGQDSVRAAAFYQQVADLPPAAQEEALLLRDSVEALKEFGAYSKVKDAVAQAEEYIQAHPGEDLTMEQARNLWGEYGPVALAAVEDPSADGRVAHLLLGEEGQEPYSLDTDTSCGTEAYSGDLGDLYQSALAGHAGVEVAQAKAAWSASSNNQGVAADDWLATGTDDYAKEARAWQALGLSAEEKPEPAAGQDALALLKATAVDPYASGASIPVPHGYNEIVATFGQPGDSSNLVTEKMPAGPNGEMVSVTVNRKIAGDLRAAFEEIQAAGLSDEISSFDGTYNPRKKRGGSTWSTHAWAIAVDLNAGEYPMGMNASRTSDRYKQVAAIMEKHGFQQLENDPMHFQYCTGY